MIGTITGLRPGGFGLIAADALGKPWDLPFRRAAVAADGFDRLRPGQRVRFDQEPVPGGGGRRHAVRVAPIPGEDPA
jgi:cold shock CspA family protein